MTYQNVRDGQWVQPRRRDYRVACCDCGLVHRMDFRIYRGRVQFRAFRAKRSTGQRRRWMKAAHNQEPTR